MALTGEGDKLRSVLYRDECWGDGASSTGDLAAKDERAGACFVGATLLGVDTGVVGPPEGGLARPLGGGGGENKLLSGAPGEAADGFWAMRAS